MNKILLSGIVATMFLLSACAPGKYYSDHPTTKEQILKRKGKPYDIKYNEDGNEMLIYQFKGEGVTYNYYLIEDGMVKRYGSFGYPG